MSHSNSLPAADKTGGEANAEHAAESSSGILLSSIATGRASRDTYRAAKSQVNQLIEQLAADGHTRLPPEDELSAKLQVSRATIRSALLSLQKEGRIQRIHGRGTFLNRHALKISANITQDRPFAELLSELGHEVRLRNEDIHVEPFPAAMLEALELTAAENACVIRRTFEASGAPAVLSVDYVPIKMISGDIGGLNGCDSIFEFIGRYCGRKVRYSVAEIVPIIPPAGVVELLDTPAGQPLMLLQHTHVDEDDQPVAFTRAYINDRFLRFSVVRTYTDS